jgi:hypothetical protein
MPRKFDCKYPELVYLIDLALFIVNFFFFGISIPLHLLCIVRDPQLVQLKLSSPYDNMCIMLIITH